MGHTEDSLPEDYPYAWREGLDLSIQDFLAKVRPVVAHAFCWNLEVKLSQYKPSMVQDDGTKPVSSTTIYLASTRRYLWV
jgi:hypothetical protein